MEIDDGGSIAFLPSTSRSYLFASSVLTLIDLVTAGVLLFRRLATMPFPAVTALVAAMFVLGLSWRLIFRTNEQMRSFLGVRDKNPANTETAEILRMCANLIYGATFLTSLVTGLLLLVVIQAFKTR